MLAVTQPASEAVVLKIELDDGTTRQMTIPPFSDFREIVVELPETRARASIRLRSETQDGSPGTLRIDRVEWKGHRARPQARLAQQGAILLVLSFLVLGLGGLSISASLIASLVLATILWALSFQDPFATVHLVRRGAALAMLGLPVIGVARLLAPRLSPWFLALLYVALLLKASWSFIRASSSQTFPFTRLFWSWSTTGAFSIFGIDSPSTKCITTLELPR